MSDILYIDPTGGISGDMLLAALLHSGVPRELIEGELALLPLRGYKMEVQKERRSGIEGLRVTISVESPRQEHRRHVEIASMIEGSGIDARARALALRVFERLAAAEARVHGVDPSEVEFHEIGAIDSIVDIVACSVALTFLSPSGVLCGIPLLGTGTVRTRHGRMPLPAPATVELLKDWPVRVGGRLGETVTPTGAAFLAELSHPTKETPPIRITSAGYGFGARKTGGLNALRVIRGTLYEPAQEGEEAVVEATIDDMNPQIFPVVIDLLLAIGASDAWTTAVNMKKGRPGTVLTAIVPRDLLSEAARIILTETTTIGLRYRTVGRVRLERRSETVDTRYGPVSVRVASLGDKVFNAAPEFEDCRAAAARAEVPLKEVFSAAIETYRRLHESSP